MVNYPVNSKPAACLIGTSNAIYRDGYAEALEKSDCFSEFHNYSIGFSSSALFSYRFSDVDFLKYDICFLEFCCNDVSLSEDRILEIVAIIEQLEFAISYVTANNYLPVVIILPIRSALPDGGGVRKAYRAISERYKVPFFDGYEFLESMKFFGGFPLEQFVDNMHLYPRVASLVGSVLARVTARVWGERSLFETLGVQGWSYRALRPPELSAGNLKVDRFSTSLLIADCVNLNSSDRLKINLAPDEEVCALALNFAGSVGVLSIDGATRVGVRVTSEHLYRNSIDMVFGIFPVYPFVKEAEGTISVFLQNDGYSDVNCSAMAIMDVEPRAYISGIILRKPSFLNIVTFYKRPQNLFRLSQSEFVSIFSEVSYIVPHNAVRAVYRALLKREPDNEGLSDYSELIAKKGIVDGLSEVLNAILDSPEFRKRDAAC